MDSINNDVKGKGRQGLAVNMLAGICHNCNACELAAKRPNSILERVMRWHRSWCPAWAAHTKVYGEKSLSPEG